MDKLNTEWNPNDDPVAKELRLLLVVVAACIGFWLVLGYAVWLVSTAI